jgi:hypothetical protein
VLSEKDKNGLITNQTLSRQTISPEKLDFQLHNHVMRDLAESDNKADTTPLFTKIFLIIFGALAGWLICYFYLQETYIMIPID